MNDLSAKLFAGEVARMRTDAAIAKAKRKPQIDFTTTFYFTDRDGLEHEIDVGIAYAASYDPGVCSGPWEDCYPPEGELEITYVELKDEPPPGVSEAEILQAVADSESIIDQAWEDYHENR